MCSPVEEGVAESVQLPERFLGVDHQSVAGDDPFVLAVHHCDESVRGRLRTDPHPWEVLLQQVPERRSSGLIISSSIQSLINFDELYVYLMLIIRNLEGVKVEYRLLIVYILNMGFIYRCSDGKMFYFHLNYISFKKITNQK